MKAFEIKNLNKKFNEFCLHDVSFSLEKGYIMGFIGSNGAGKTTTMKAMLNLTPKDSGTILIDGMDLAERESEIKKQVAYVHLDFCFEKSSRIKKVAGEVKPFYENWNEERYLSLLKRFRLDPEKKLGELSSGMLVKFYLALALSHDPKLLVLDEPMSAMDPSSRDDLIRLFQEYIKDGEHSVFYSTHITSDLEKCADYITYIKDGKIISSTDINSFKEGFALVKGRRDQLLPELKASLIGCFENDFGFEGLLHAEDAGLAKGLDVSIPDIDTVMVYMDGENKR